MNSAQGKITVRRAAKAGNDGSDAVVYELRPSVSSVKKAGTTYTPASLTCHVQKIVGGLYSALTTAGELTLEQLALQYAIDGGTYTSINGTTAITPSGSIIYFRLIKDTVVIATMSVPIVSDGTNGAEGIEGRAIRTVKWVPGETYHNDAPTASAPRYIDILLIFDASGAVTTRYQCVSTYTSGTSETAPTGDGNAHWTKVNNMGPLYTPMFMADNGDITFLSSNQILIKKADGTVTAGVSGAGTGSSGYRFWAGGNVPGNAPFSVDELGHLKASSAEISGNIRAALFYSPMQFLENGEIQPIYISLANGFTWNLSNFAAGEDIYLPSPTSDLAGAEVILYNGMGVTTRSYYGFQIKINASGNLRKFINKYDTSNDAATSIFIPLKKMITLRCVSTQSYEINELRWYIVNPDDCHLLSII